jgi:hypothetical protein
MTKRLDPAIKYQNAEERYCECGAAGSGEGHSDFCPWLRLDAKIQQRVFGKVIDEPQN